MDLEGALVADRYRVQRLLARGGMSAVFAAHDEHDKRDVALKVLGQARANDERFADRFQAEACALARLQHPNIVQMQDFGIDARAGAYLVLDLLQGQPLKIGAVMPWRDVVSLMQQIALALSCAHEHNVLHRDLKPSNVFLVAPDQQVRVLDFGVAKIVDDENGTKTTAGIVLGTPGYLAPERLTKSGNDARSDLYALGVIGWEALAGRQLFQAKSNVLISMKHLTEKAKRISTVVDVPTPLDDLLASLLEKEPKLRPSSAKDVADSLARML
jgi:eukaryotic-like serine/threonine-protein kinase